jgi:hypothetical protein
VSKNRDFRGEFATISEASLHDLRLYIAESDERLLDPQEDPLNPINAIAYSDEVWALIGRVYAADDGSVDQEAFEELQKMFVEAFELMRADQQVEAVAAILKIKKAIDDPRLRKEIGWIVNLSDADRPNEVKGYDEEDTIKYLMGEYNLGARSHARRAMQKCEEKLLGETRYGEA